MCTFAHDLVIMIVLRLQNYQNGQILQNRVCPNFYFLSLTCTGACVYERYGVLADNNKKIVVLSFFIFPLPLLPSPQKKSPAPQKRMQGR